MSRIYKDCCLFVFSGMCMLPKQQIYIVALLVLVAIGLTYIVFLIQPSTKLETGEQVTETPVDTSQPNNTSTNNQTPLVSITPPSEGTYALVIEGAGATFQYPQISQWSNLFKQKTGISVNYQSVGSGAGQRMFLVDRVVHFAASDPPLSRSQWENYTGKVVQVPWIMGAVVVVYNVPEVDVPLNLTGEVLARIYRGEIVYWNDPAIAELNQRIAGRLPQKEIIAVHRSDSSGTTEVFTIFLHKSAPHIWPRDLVGKLVNWPVDATGRGIGAKGNEGVTTTVLQTPYSIGYVELSYALEHGLSYATIRNAAGRFILPTIETISAAIRGIKLPESPLDDFSQVFVEVVYSPNPEAYPISTVVFGLFWSKYDDPAVARSIVSFLNWIVSEGYNYMVKGYVAPPQEAVSLVRKAAEIIRSNSLG